MRVQSWFPWNGSKRWLLPDLLEITNRWEAGGSYIEPFVGGGSIARAIRMQHPRAHQILGDANPWLMSVYEWQRMGVPYVLPENFSDLRYWRGLQDADIPDLTVTNRATRFAVCLLTAWGNRWETLADGEFKSTANQAWCAPEYLRSRLVQFFGTAGWLEPSDECAVGDWASTAARAQPGDLLYLDPPYTETLGYGNQTWTLSNQLDVVDLAIEKAKAGVAVVVSNHSTIERLYRRAGFEIKIIGGQKAMKTRRTRDEMLARSGLAETDWWMPWDIR